MKKFTVFGLVLIFIGFVYACGQHSQTEKGTVLPNNADSQSCVKETIKDPNNPKPMALMMRQLAMNADSMKSQLLRGEQLDSLKYPFIKFYLVEPTDPSVLEPQFYENARLFQEAYLALFRHPREQVKYHNLVISKCIGCHENYCSGPLKRIRKLLITP